jgi:dihydroorotate dehydrogenase
MYKLFRKIFFSIDPETTHNSIIALGGFMDNTFFKKPIELIYNFEDPKLNSNVFGINFKNPVGLAAGFDKDGKILNFLPALGFGHIEMGNITALPRPGNPKPRLFRLPQDRALINRMGLNNQGADAIYERLKNQNFSMPIGINIAKTHDSNILGDKAITDFLYTFKKLNTLFAYTTLNISCPNTTEGKTFEEAQALNELLTEIKKYHSEQQNKKPILVKISPDIDLAQLDQILEVCEFHKIDGYVLCNTSKFRKNLKTNSQKLSEIGKGGLSGLPIQNISTQFIAYTYKLLKRPCIIGLGGVDSAESAYEKILAGASLIQIYTGLIYEGPSLVKKINQGLVKLLSRDGFKNISEAVGKKL